MGALVGSGNIVGIGLDLGTLLTGILIFFARIVDVSVGTMRTISIVHGRTKTAFFLGFVEVSIWLVVITAVLAKIVSRPILGIFYALGFSAGNAIGILLERRIALGHIVLRVISNHHGNKMAATIREAGHAVTTFEGQGMLGPVTLLYVACRRKDLKEILPIIKGIEADAFYIIEHAGEVSRLYRPAIPPSTGWRTAMKRK